MHRTYRKYLLLSIPPLNFPAVSQPPQRFSVQCSCRQPDASDTLLVRGQLQLQNEITEQLETMTTAAGSSQSISHSDNLLAVLGDPPMLSQFMIPRPGPAQRANSLQLKDAIPTTIDPRIYFLLHLLPLFLRPIHLAALLNFL